MGFRRRIYGSRVDPGVFVVCMVLAAPFTCGISLLGLAALPGIVGKPRRRFSHTAGIEESNAAYRAWASKPENLPPEQRERVYYWTDQPAQSRLTAWPR